VDEPDSSDIAATRAGNAAAYKRLIRRHEPSVARQLWRFTRNRQEHEELILDVFVLAYYSLGGFAGKRPFARWLSSLH